MLTRIQYYSEMIALSWSVLRITWSVDAPHWPKVIASADPYTLQICNYLNTFLIVLKYASLAFMLNPRLVRASY